MLFLLAWRNLWRSPRRTAITLAALTLGVAGIVFLHSFRESSYGQLMRMVTEGLVGHLQVHGRGYQESPEVSNYLRDPVAIEARLRPVLPGLVAERRVLGAGLAASKESAAGALVMGLDTDPKRGSSMMTLRSGRSFSSRAPHEAVVGTELAEELSLRLGDEVVLVGQAADGSVANDRYAVVGTCDAGSNELNATAVFLSLAAAQDFFGLGDGVHELVVNLPTDDEDVSAPLAAARAALDLNAVEALSWNELLPELKSTMRSKRKNQHLVDVIVLLIVALGVWNAMTMSTFERTGEFGVMSAVGTRPGRIGRLVLAEAVLQGLLGLGAGVLLAAILLYGIGEIHYGVLAQTDLLGVRFPPAVRLRLHTGGVVSASVTALATVVAGGLLPALRAARLRPAVALRYQR